MSSLKKAKDWKRCEVFERIGHRHHIRKKYFWLFPPITLCRTLTVWISCLTAAILNVSLLTVRFLYQNSHFTVCWSHPPKQEVMWPQEAAQCECGLLNKPKHQQVTEWIYKLLTHYHLLFHFFGLCLIPTGGKFKEEKWRFSVENKLWCLSPPSGTSPENSSSHLGLRQRCAVSNGPCSFNKWSCEVGFCWWKCQLCSFFC